MLLSLLLPAAVLAFQGGVFSDTVPTRRDSTRQRNICISLGNACSADTAGRRIAVTPQHLATAFRDSAAKTLLLRARAARMQQDSAIVSYDATAYQRMSAGMRVGRIGRDRVIFRTESASRVRWHRDIGAHIDVLGARSIFPGATADEANRDMVDDVSDMTLLPYYPGQESLWIGNGMAKSQVNDEELVHPLADGAEAYYTYATGDAAGFRLPDGRQVRLQELEVRPRRVSWNVVVGSLWFDADRGQLVRAAYRLGEPIDILAMASSDADDDDIPVAVRALLTPFRGQITAMAVEYGLHQGRFWLPRFQSAEGEAQASFMRIPFSMHQQFRYSAVNATELDSLPRIQLSQRITDRMAADSLPPEQRQAWLDSTRAVRGAERKARADSVKQGLVKSLRACDTGSVYTAVETRMDRRTPVLVTVPCDAEALASSSELPKSIFSDGEEMFDLDAHKSLIEQALTLGAQPGFSPRRPVLAYGLQLTRFNRVEGLSVGLQATQQLGRGYLADATVRFGLADREPNVELGLARTNLARTARVGAYNHLVAANDWGNPLSFGSSMSALLFGRDEGFYYRTSGVDLTLTEDQGDLFSWRLFAERQRSAAADNAWSLANAVASTEFAPNIVATEGVWTGAVLRMGRAYGRNPRGWRAFGDLRVEGAAGETGYGRAAFDATVSRTLGPASSSLPLASLTLSSGTSIGDLPVQRLWYVGGTHTVRGQPAGTGVGDAYWFGRFELGQDVRLARVALFGDVGWAGSRDAFSNGRAMSGAGAGVGLLDGLVRLDVAKGIYPSTRWRTDLYLEARF